MRGLDLRVEAGERVLLLGPSGGGKTTLLLALAGLLDQASGGEEEGSLSLGGLAPADRRAAAGILFQDPESQLVMARAGDDVAFGLEERCVPAAEIWPRVDVALASVDFPYGRQWPTRALSGGEKQRLALAGVLALEPRLLLLDEPTSSLDAGGAVALREIVARIGRHRTLLLVEHRVESFLDLVDRVVVVAGDQGLIADGPPDRVFQRRGDELGRMGVWVPGPSPRQVAASPPGPEVVRAEGLTFYYPQAARPALRAVDLGLRVGEALALTGPNGSGKSTLALLLAGLLRPGRGKVLAPGLDPKRPEPWHWPARSLARRIGMVFQEPVHQLLSRTVRQEVRLGPQRTGGDLAAADGWLERMGLGPLAEANPFSLSGGEKRRLTLAAVLACGPPVLVLDEPTFGQDRRTFELICEVLADFRGAGGALCFSTHEQRLVDVLADRIEALAPP